MNAVIIDCDAIIGGIEMPMKSSRSGIVGYTSQASSMCGTCMTTCSQLC